MLFYNTDRKIIMKKLSQKELAEMLKITNSAWYNLDTKMPSVHFFGNSINKYELFDIYKTIYNKQTTKNHLECYNQVRLIIFNKCLEEIKYAIIEAVKNFDGWAKEQFKMFVDCVIMKLLTGSLRYRIYENDYDSIINSYLTYRGKEDISIHTFKNSKKYDDEINRVSLHILISPIKWACIALNNWEKVLTKDQINFINIYRHIFFYKSPVVDFIGETSSPQYDIKMDYACEESPEFYSVLFQLYLMGNNKKTNISTLKNAILDYNDPRMAYEDFILYFWKWAQKEKGTSSIPSQGLKSFCCDVLKVVCDNNSYSRYNSHNFKNVNEGWRILNRQNENILKKRRTLNQD